MARGHYSRNEYPLHPHPYWSAHGHGFGNNYFPPELYQHPHVFRDGHWTRAQRRIGMHRDPRELTAPAAYFPTGMALAPFSPMAPYGGPGMAYPGYMRHLAPRGGRRGVR